MSRRSRYGTPGLLARHTASGIVGSVLVAVLVAVTVFSAALAPRALARLGSEELRHTLAEMSPVLRDLRGLGQIGLLTGMDGAPVDEVLGPTDRAVDRAREFLPLPLRDLAGDPQWVARSASDDADLPPDAAQVTFSAKLAVDLDWLSRVRMVDGAEPAAWTGSDSDPDADPPLEVALDADSAAELGLEVGNEVGYGALDLVIAGLYEPRDAADPDWLHTSDLAGPSVDEEPGVIPTVRATAYVAPESAGGLTVTLMNGALTAWVPIDASGIDYADAALIATQTREAFAADSELPNGGRLGFSTRFADAIDVIVARVVTASALLALSLSGLLGVLLAVFALGVSSIVERRRPALSLARARGAGDAQVRGAMVLEGLVISVPTAALAVAAAVAVIPDAAGAESWALPVVVATSVPVLFGLLSGARALSDRRSDLRVRGGRPRLVIELVVIGLAVLSLYLLARRGIVASAEAVGIDPLLALTPLLLAASVCIVTLRLYPAPLRFILGALRRGDGATGLVGAARAVRSPSLGFAASFALVIGVSIVVFSSIMGTTLRDSVVTGARDQVGADLQVSATAIGPDLIDDLGRLPGVTAVASLEAIPGARIVGDLGTSGITLVIADTAALHEVRPDIPAVNRLDGGRIPLLVSSDAVGRIGGDPSIARVPVAVVGTIPVDALPGVARSWVLLDATFADDLGRTAREPQRVLIRLDDGTDVAPLIPRIDRLVTDAQPEATRGVVTVTSAAQVLDELRTSPVIAGIEAALPAAALAALLLTLLAVALATLAAAGTRSHLVGVLRVLGADARQQRGILVWEFAPVVLTSVLVGTIVGVTLPYVVTSVVDLRPFVGGRFAPDPVIDPLIVAGASVAVIIVAVIAGAIALAVGRRIAPAATLKMGER